jgi:hypothetical protein
MKLLLIESTPGDSFGLEDRLVASGHRVLACSDDSGSPCRGIEDAAACPLAENVDLAILSRAEEEAPTIREAGVLCARRHRVPVVHVATGAARAELAGPGGVEIARDVGTRRVERADAARIGAALADVGAEISVARYNGGIAIGVRVPESAAQSASAWDRGVIADRARAAARAYDPSVRVVDVAVSVEASP